MDKLFTLLLFFCSFHSFSQSFDKNYLGRTRIYVGNQGYDITESGSAKTLEVGLESEGFIFQNDKYDNTAALPIRVEVYSNNLKGLSEYEISLIRKNFGSNLENKTFKSFVSIDLLTLQRSNIEPLIVDKIKYFNLKYTGIVSLANDKFKIVFEGEISPTPRVRTIETDQAFKSYIHDFTVASEEILDTPLGTFGLTSDALSFLDTDKELERNDTLTSLLGDSSFSIGVQLFNFIQARVGMSLDSVNIRGANNIIKFDKVSKELNIDMKIGRLFKKGVLKEMSLYFYMRQNNVNSFISNYPDYAAEVYNKDATRYGMGIRIPLKNAKKKDNPRIDF